MAALLVPRQEPMPAPPHAPKAVTSALPSITILPEEAPYPPPIQAANESLYPSLYKVSIL